MSLGLWMTLISTRSRFRSASPRRCATAARFDVCDLRVVLSRLRDPELPVRDPAGGAVRRRQLLGSWFPLRGLTSDDFARPGLAAQDHSTTSGTSRCRRRAGAGGFATSTMLTKNSLPRRDQEAIRADRAGQGPQRAARALRPRVPQRDAARRRRISRRPSSARPVHRRAADRASCSRSTGSGCSAYEARSSATIR
jgi:hypothetical protein